MMSPRDFILTNDGLIFAVINDEVAFLRYYPSANGSRVFRGRLYEKVESTKFSFAYLEENFPYYIKENQGIRIQRCPPESVDTVFSPKEKLKNLCNNGGQNEIIKKCLQLNNILDENPLENKGITGSILVDMSTPDSDIDFVVYGSDNFDCARKMISESSVVRDLNYEDLKSYYNKRFPEKPSLTFEEFCWHENRKHNLGKIDGTLFNLLMVGDDLHLPESKMVKKAKITCIVTDAKNSFNHPAVYEVEHALVTQVVSYTHTFTGQAMEGEKIEVSGNLEKTDNGNFIMIVGSMREAPNEYIKVIM